MAIRSSRIMSNQLEGTRWRVWYEFVLEPDGRRERVLRMYASEGDAAANLSTVAAETEASLTATEVRRVVKRLPEVFPVLVRATKAQIAARLREAYQQGEGAEVLRIAAALKRWYDAGSITNANIDAMFGTNSVTRPALLSRIAAKAQQYADLVAARGE